MQPDMMRLVRDADLTGWTPVDVEYGPTSLPVLVPPGCRILEMAEVWPLSNPRDGIRASIHEPIGTKPLPEILRAKEKSLRNLSVCITTSDITRPVPYRGEAGILPPLLGLFEEAGIAREHITLLVGTGTHRPSAAEEKVAMFGEEVTAHYRIVDHDCDDPELVDIGKTRAGTEVLINPCFIRADVKIATALVESHFMAGASGGRKAVCPALVSRRTISECEGGRERPAGRERWRHADPCCMRARRGSGGPLTYKSLLHLLKLQGPAGYLSALRHPGWRFTKDQWEPQMWGKVLDKVGEEGLIYCSARLSAEAHEIVPGGMRWDYPPDGEYADDLERARAMVQSALVVAVRRGTRDGRSPSVAFIKEGPYAVPVRRASVD